nr:hypothetical protein A6C57_14000 [Fibrella sp. ES10-3-2-2]
MLLGLAVGAYAQTAGVNLKLEKTISNAAPALGEVVTYTVAVTNMGSATATSVVVSESMTPGLSTYLSSTASVGGFTFSTASSTGSWTVGSVNPGQTVTLQISVRVDGEGVAFNSAEIASMDGTDTNSIPGNGSLVEDDYDNACFSVPLTWYAGDEYIVDKPTGFTAVTWFVNGNPISASTTEASVDADGNLLIKAPGIFSFSGKLNGCDVSNCCNILVNPGLTSSLGDFVFEDKNRDGIQDAGDVAIPGVTVTLFLNGTAIATTTTDVAGAYSFTGLTPGTSNSYSVGFTTPAGFIATTPLSGTDASKDSDADPLTGNTLSVTLAAGEFNPTLDAGFYKPASLGDYVFNDANRDGIQDAGDTPIPNVVVTLYQNGSAIATTTTDATGLYSFTGLTPGTSNTYSVGFSAPAGFESTSANIGFDGLDSDADPITGLTAGLTLSSGESNTSVDAGFYQSTAGLGDYVFEDKNANGIQDLGDVAIPGVVVTLYTNGSAVATTTTNSSGLYSFTGLTPTTPYVVGFGQPAGYVPTLANVGGDDALDSDADKLTGLTGVYSLTANEFNPTVDAGFFKPASLGDYVFNDVNRDGIQNVGDLAIPGVVVTLYQNGSAIATTTTDASGLYSFTGLTPGSSNSYSVGFTSPAGLSATAPLSGTNGSLDSDADPITGLTLAVTLSSGESNTTLDAGFFQPTAGLGDYVFEDKNANGIQDLGDVAIPGVVVTLYTNGSAIATTTTNSSGLYSFTGLTPATPYVVGFGQPAGYMSTLANVGSDDALDSDADKLTGLTGVYSLTADEFNPTVDAGFFKPASLGDYVFNDTNRDGIQNTGDTAIPGVVVTLYQNGSAIATTTTDVNGLYSFTGLTPGSSNSYAVGFTAPAGLSATAPLSGTDASLDSDADPITGRTLAVTLSSGESNTTLDAGFFKPTAGLGDYVFEDKNANGIQDAGDVAIPGVVVTLYTNGSAIATTTTNASGLYSFTGLTPATQYVVGFGQPAGYMPTLANVGSDDALDSDADKLTGLTGVYSLTADEFNPTVDAGFFKPASLGDYVFNDVNRDGVQNTGDTAIPGVVVTLYQNGSAIATTTTDVNGLYSFTGLTPGSSNSYAVGFTTPTGLSATSPNVGFDGLDSDVDPITGRTQAVTLSSGESNTSVDAGFFQPTAGLGDYVFEDKNANGIQDLGDVAIPGVVVTLYTNGSAIATTTTNASGLYSFTGLTPATPYVVGFGQPAGYMPTLANVGSDDALDSDADKLTGLTGVYSLTADEFNPTVDAGFFKPASLGDYVFNDTNRDGIQNTGDTAIPGVVVTLYQNGSAIATTTTDVNGLYSFTGLTPGSSNSYAVGFTAPAGLSATAPLSGTDASLDSDADPITGRTLAVTLSSGESNTTLDAGFFKPTAGLGDYVFEDKNANGIQDAGDVAIPGVVVTLYTNGSAIATTTTNASGLYSFTGLTPATPYVVGFGQPAGYMPTLANVGNDALDSDADKLTGLTGVYSLTADEFNPTVDAGFFKPASLGDYVFNDTNRDGIQNTGDTAIPGVVVTLYQNGSAIATTTTDVNGLYSFTGLTPGSSNSYAVGFTAPAGLSATAPLSGTDASLDSDADPITGRTLAVTLSSGESNTTLDAGFYQPTAGLGDYVFEDKNANGIQDLGDVAIPGVVVTLYTNGSAIATTTTNSSGLYSFTGLTPATPYVVGFGQPAGYMPTLANVGSDDALDSDADKLTGLTGVYSLTADEFNPTVDAGFFKPASLGDYVFNDTNRDGIQNTGDTAIPGVVVTLYQNGSAIATTTTDVNGLYSFTGLTPGSSNSYVVGFTTPTGLSATAPLSGTDASLDSDADPITGRTQAVTLSSGESNTTLDAGFFQPTAGLGDYVFEDKNANGIQDLGDVAIPGVVVTLYTNGSAIATTTTNASGLYSFTGLTPATPYVVGFGQPAGYVPTLANVGSDDALDSDADKLTGLTGVYSLTADEFNPTVDAGFFKPASLGDYVFNDTNRDGIQNTGDTAIPGVVVTLYQNGSAIVTTTTDVNGLYSFTGLTPGTSNTYAVGFIAPTGFVSTSANVGFDGLDSDVDPVLGRTTGVTLSSGESNTSVDAGFFQPTAGLGDYVFEDKNANGIQDAGDVAIQGVLVTLYQNGTAIATTTTDGSGLYSFTGLTPGNQSVYQVGFATPSGFMPTTTNVGVNDEIDSDLIMMTSRTGTYTLASGEFNPTVDAGFYKPASLGDYVFNDRDQNGVQSPGDTPIAGVTVVLYQNGTPVATTTTDVNGLYSFTGLTPGASNTYSVGITAPSGFTATTPLSGTDRSADSDINPITGRSAGLTLTSGESNSTVDGGFVQQTAGLGDYVFEDKNANGIQDAGDVAIPGVVVTLYTNGSAIATTTTNASGLYSFTGLTPATPYVVGFGQPTGYMPTLANVGSDALDSDADKATGLTGVYSLTANEFNSTVDAGFFKPASLGDYVFNDTNRDGVQNTGDTPISGVVVTLYQNGSAVATTTTNGSGLYSFTGLTPGSSNTYSVGFTAPTGFVPTTPNVGFDGLDSDIDPVLGRTTGVTLSSGESNTSVDGGFFRPTAGLGDYVFEDKNANGIQDAGDVAIPGVTVTLYTNGSAISNAVTNASGYYSFTGLTPGTPYMVGFGQPMGYLPTMPNVGSDALDSDADKATGLTGVYSLTADEFNSTVDAGFFRPASLGNYVFVDVNRNGIQDLGDSALPGVVVTLYQNGSAVATTTSDATGMYSFTGLTPGTGNNYSVNFTTPVGYTATTPLSGTNRENDSDIGADPLTGRSQNITLTSGEYNSTVDGGFIRNVGAIGDYVWFDYNNDGQQGAIGVEPGVPGITVQLFAAANTSTPLATTTTDAMGKYLFDNLPSGTYVVKFTAPAGSVFTTKNRTGVSTEFDSNAGVVDGLTDVITIDVTQPLSSTARVNLTIDAGIVPYGSIGNYVWRDTNNDGIQNDGNTGIAGITVQLFGSGDLTNALSETVTDGTGYYLFDNLISGTYKVKFTLPTGETFTLNEVGNDRAVDSDAGADGFSKLITINTSLPLGNVGRNNLTIDAGVQTKCATPLMLVAGTTNMSLCVGGATSVSAIAAGASKVNWYLDATAQVLSFTTASGQLMEVAPTTNLTYYVQAETADGCKSEVKPVVIIVNARPNTPSCLKETTICKDKTFDLTTVKLNNVPLAGSTLEWRTGISETSPLVTNLTAVGAGEYYLFERSRYGCYSYPAVLTVNTIDCSCQSVAAVSTSLTSGSVCEGDKITLVASIGGSATGVTWMPSNTATAGTLTGSNSLTAMYTPSAADIAAGQVLFTVVTNDPDGNGVCTPARSTVAVVINKRPDAPIGVACEEEILCKGSSTKLFGFTTGAKLNWYANGVLIGTTTSGKSLTITPLVSTTYTAEAVSAAGCTSLLSTPVIVTVKATCLADLAVAKKIMTEGPYKIGDVVAYGITVTNNGPVNATAVAVTDMLPASLEFVSATPASDYNASTGIWTVGNLVNGADRSLILQVKINGGGSVVNRATVVGVNDDPNRPENNTSTAGITVVDCNTPAPTIACAITAICQHDPAESTVLTARDCGGTVKWSNGMTGNRIEVFPTMTTTYTASCVVGTCISEKSNPITVTVTEVNAPTILASADKVCAGGVVSLTAVGCQNGQLFWSDSRLTGSVVSLTVTSETRLTVQCRINNCYSTSTEKVIKVGNDLPKPTVVCSTTEACPGESVELTAKNCVGTPRWSTGETTASIIVMPTEGNNSYSVQCVDGACTSPRSNDYTIKVIPAAVPTVVASASSVCTGTVVSLTATGCAGNVTWSNNMTGSVISVTMTATSSYYAFCKVRECISQPSKSVTIQVGKPSAPTIRAIPNTAICSGESVTLTVAEGCANGTVKWMPGNLTGSSVIVVPTINTDYTAICVTDNCESVPSNTVKVIVKTAGTAPTIAASAMSVCNGGSVTLTAGNCTNGIVNWSNGMTGTSIVVMPTADANTFSASCKQATTCGSPQSRVITIGITTPPAPTVVCSTSVICPGESVELTVQNCSGTPMWSTGAADNGKATISVSPTSTTSYSVKCVDGACMSAPSQLYTIQVVPVPVPTVSASSTIISEGESVTLTASNCPGTVTWNTNQTGTSIVVAPGAAVSYYTAVCRFRTCNSDPSPTITVRKRLPDMCTAKAGSLVATVSEVCASTMTTVTLSATDNGGRVVPANFAVRYVLTKGANLVIQQTSATPTFTVPATEAGIYTIHTLVYNPATLDLSVVVPGTTTGSDVLNLIHTKMICADLDVTGARTKVKYVPAPIILGSGKANRCYGEVVSLTATGCENGQVSWGGGAVGSVFTFTVVHDSWFSAVCTVDGCSSKPSEMIDHYMVQLKVPTIGCDKPTVCAGDPATLTAQGCENAGYLWSNGATTSSIVVTPGESTTYAVKCTLDACQSDWSPACKLTVGQPGTPTITVNNSTNNVTTCFGTPVTLTASGCPAGAFAIWSNNQVGSSITVNPATTATYTAQCCTSNNCKSKVSNAIVVTVLPKVPQPKTTDLSNACPILAVNLASAVGPVQTTGGTLEYYSSSTISPATKLTNTNVTVSGTYYVVEKTTSGCYSLPSPIQVNIIGCGDQLPCGDNPVTASAGLDAAVCAAKTYKLDGKATGNNLTTQWTTSGTGTFDNAFSGQALYTPSATDVQAGQVTLTFSVKTNNTACGTKSDAMVLTLNGPKEQPTVSVIGATQLCFGDSVKLQAPAGFTYLWTSSTGSKATTQSIMVKQGGSYSVQVFDQNGCSSVPSAPVTIHVAAPVAAPLVANLRNACPATTVSLSTALAATTAGSTYEFRMGESVSSALVMNPGAAGDGTYYVFERTTSQCVSMPAKVVVKVINCAVDNGKSADVAITKLVSNTSAKVGEALTYTLKVKNNGPNKAYNVDIRDVLPQGLNLVVSNSPVSYTVANGAITKRFDSLAVGASDSIVFMARLTKKGSVMNTASITYSDVIDATTGNNTSSVTVTDNSPFKAGLIGLAKEVIGSPSFTNDSTLAVAYRFAVTNYGDEDLTAVGVTDDLEAVFGAGKVLTTQLTTTEGSKLVANPAFTGAGSTTQMLAASSTLVAGQTATFMLTTTVRLNKADSVDRTFMNTAMATAMNSTTQVSDASVAGNDADPDKDGDPTNNSGGTSITIQATPKPQAKQLGVAMSVASVAKQADDSYNVTYKVYVKNFGSTTLTNVSLLDTIANAFPSPSSYSIVSGLVANAGSQLVVSGDFDGSNAPYYLNSWASRLAAGKQDTLTYTINVKPNGANGPFYSQVHASGKPENTTLTVSDKSNAGTMVVPEDDTRTAVRFDLPSSLIGLAKAVGTPVRVANNVWDVPYSIKVCNLGTTDLKQVQVVDDLSKAFGNGAQVTSVTVTADAGLKVNPAYTGLGLLTNLLDTTASSLPVKAIRYVQLVVRVDVTQATSLSFTNIALGSAMGGSVAVRDTSNTGSNVDPDGDLDPRNNNNGTGVVLNSLPGAPYIGVAMMVSDTARQANGSYNVTYRVLVKNYGTVALSNVMLTDSLSKVFNPQVGASFSVLGTPIASAGSKLKVNPGFNGNTDPVLVTGDSTSRLAVGATDTLLVRINVVTAGQTGTFFNTVYAVAKAGLETVRDVSTNGMNPDPNANSNPTDLNESEATPLNLPLNLQTLFIPEGFSPNGDGVNDTFVITGAQGLTVNLEIFNRWGHRVYVSEDYKNDWDGKPNTGAQVGNTSNGLPDGTYFYVVKLSDGREFVRYMTINR